MKYVFSALLMVKIHTSTNTKMWLFDRFMYPTADIRKVIMYSCQVVRKHGYYGDIQVLNFLVVILNPFPHSPAIFSFSLSFFKLKYGHHMAGALNIMSLSHTISFHIISHS